MAAKGPPLAEDEARIYCFVKCLAKLRKATDIRPPVTCTNSSNGSRTYCEECRPSCYPSEKVPIAMRGDLYDLFTILRLTDIVLQYTDSHGQQLWTVAERKKILTVAYALMKAFRDAKTKHRVEHHMKTGITERRDTGWQAIYASFIQGRQGAISGNIPWGLGSAPMTEGVFQQWDESVRILMLRLEPGDRGFADFTHAKEVFFDKMVKMFKTKGDEGVEQKHIFMLWKDRVSRLSFSGVGWLGG